MKRSTLTGLLGLTTGMIVGVIGCKTCKCVKKMAKEYHSNSCTTILDNDYDDYCDCGDYCDCDDYEDEEFDIDDEDGEYDIEYKYEPADEGFQSDEIVKEDKEKKSKLSDIKSDYKVEDKYKDKSYNVENKDKKNNKV